MVTAPLISSSAADGGLCLTAKVAMSQRERDNGLKRPDQRDKSDKHFRADPSAADVPPNTGSIYILLADQRYWRRLLRNKVLVVHKAGVEQRWGHI